MTTFLPYFVETTGKYNKTATCRYAKQVGAMHFHTSAKLNQNIEEMFLDLTRRMMQHADQAEQKSTLTRTNSTRRNVVVVEDEMEQSQPTRSSCCTGGGSSSSAKGGGDGSSSGGFSQTFQFELYTSLERQGLITIIHQLYTG